MGRWSPISMLPAGKVDRIPLLLGATSKETSAFFLEGLGKVTGRANASWGGGFILLGFSDQPQLEKLLSMLISIFYVLTLMGNGTIILVACLDAQLHTPMYFFLSHLAILDLTLINCVIPQMLVNLWGPDRTIPFAGCAVQLFISLGLGGTQCVFLAFMAYDRYIAICQPLHYVLVMHPGLCWKLLAISWGLGFGNSSLHTPLTLSLPRCGHHQINHFFCENPPLVKLACVDTSSYEAEIFVLSVFFLLIPLLFILVSYGFIARAVLEVKSAAGRRKASGTCGAHLAVVSIFYGSILFIYLQPKDQVSQDADKFVALFYNLITPALNPLIYTLRNEDVKGAIRRLVLERRGVQIIQA
ncbi:olfactory receptor 2W3-like [Ornithorhynchus anatinus]|uniref:olfactory receptor 2W3-like n=1 Tax=Ornithorhynchus anatinus TaxID=9258 RepID=UPI000223EBEE|nr:olfactory receptor 2W3-like [Ornithorhynchus anatinus]